MRQAESTETHCISAYYTPECIGVECRVRSCLDLILEDLVDEFVVVDVEWFEVNASPVRETVANGLLPRER